MDIINGQVQCELKLPGCYTVSECYSGLADANCCEPCAYGFMVDFWKNKDGGEMSKEKSSWKAEYAELVVHEELEGKKEENEKVTIKNDCSNLDDFCTVFSSKDGDNWKRITFNPTTADEQLKKIETYKKSGAPMVPFYKLVPDAKAMSAAQEKSESRLTKKETTMSETKTEKTKKAAVKAAKKGGVKKVTRERTGSSAEWFFTKMGEKPLGPFDSKEAARTAGAKKFSEFASRIGLDGPVPRFVSSGAFRIFGNAKSGERVTFELYTAEGKSAFGKNPLKFKVAKVAKKSAKAKAA